jgi:hypothetical protein
LQLRQRQSGDWQLTDLPPPPPSYPIPPKSIGSAAGAPMAVRRQLAAAYDGKCAMCKKRCRSPVLDHCHKTRRLRGLICCRCNLALGYFEAPGLLASAEAYLANFRSGAEAQIRAAGRPEGMKA